MQLLRAVSAAGLTFGFLTVLAAPGQAGCGYCGGVPLYPPAPIYVPPPAFYVQPRPVYVPQPVYVRTPVYVRPVVRSRHVRYARPRVAVTVRKPVGERVIRANAVVRVRPDRMDITLTRKSGPSMRERR
jgi:hypothetical protein